MINPKNTLIIIATFLFSACSFNKIFLQPTTVPANAKELTMSSPTDTTFVKFEPVSHQPTFLKQNKDTIEFDYTIESVNFESSNGNTLNGWMIKPKNYIPTTTLLHFHGNGGFILSQYQALTPLLKFGFQIFIFDYSGYGFSEGKATRKNVLIDGNSALTYLKSRPDIKNTRLVIYGQSLGGHLSAVVASQRQADIDGLVIEGAFSSHKDIAAESAGIFGRMFVSEQYCAVKSIRTYKKPVLVIHSTEDDIIPFEMGEKIYANANEPKNFYEIKKCHICGPEFYADSIAIKIENLFKAK